MLTKIDIDNYNELKIQCQEYAKKIEKIAKLYFDKKLKDGDWQHYSGWYVTENYIVISYSYTDYYCNTDEYTEFDSIKVDLNDFLEFSQE